jgi:PAS domain S-box-containing protein
MTEVATFERIAARERASREEAEQLLEEKSLELYYKNKELTDAARKLTQTHSILGEVMASVPDAIITCTEEFHIRLANKAASELLSVSDDILSNSYVHEYLPNIRTHLKNQDDGVFLIDQCVAKAANGTEIPVEIRGRKGYIGKKSSYLFVIHDITARLKAETHREQIRKQLDESQRLEAIGALSSGIAHEINTPIQFISDNLTYLRRATSQLVSENECEASKNKNEESLAEEIDIALEDSVEGIKQVRDIILLMKDFAHPGSADKDFVNINELVENVLKFCRSKHKHLADVKLLLEPDLPAVQCRHGQVQQVILNIVMNALDALEESDNANKMLQLRTEQNGDTVRLLISDTGPGIPEKLKSKIFLPFFTTKPVGKGTGQGLALAKDCIMKGHGGRLSLVHEAGFATTFLIELPITNDNIAQASQTLEHAV